MRTIANLLSFGAGSIIGTQATARVANWQNPRPMPRQHAGALDHPMRLRYRDVRETLGLFGFQAGMSVLDLGCGTGTFTIDMARMVGETGAVYAVDLHQSLLDIVQERAVAAGVAQQVHLHHSGAYDLPLPDESMDLVVMIATLAEIPDKARALREVWRVLKPGGRLAVSEELPDPAYAPAHVVSKWIEDAGFLFGGRNGNFFCYNLLYIKEIIKLPTR